MAIVAKQSRYLVYSTYVCTYLSLLLLLLSLLLLFVGINCSCVLLDAVHFVALQACDCGHFHKKLWRCFAIAIVIVIYYFYMYLQTYTYIYLLWLASLALLILLLFLHLSFVYISLLYFVCDFFAFKFKFSSFFFWKIRNHKFFSQPNSFADVLSTAQQRIVGVDFRSVCSGISCNGVHGSEWSVGVLMSY